MSNKETLQSYNNKLIKNNDDLQTVIDMVNNLPEAGDGPSEDLTEEMTSYDEKLTTQETTLSDIVSALKFKAKPETGDEPEEPEEKKYLYLIKDGVEQTDITGGYTITRKEDGEGTNTIINGDGFIGLCGQVWSSWSMQFNNKIDFAKYPKLYVEYAYPLSSMPYASGHVDFVIYDVYGAKEHVLIRGTGVKERTTDIIDFSDTGTLGALQIRFSNNGDGSNYTRYPIQIFNLYLEEDPRPLQNKSIEIVENKYTEVTADEGYFGLNKVKIATMVSTGGSIGEIFSTEEVMTNKKWIDGKPIFRKVFTTTLPNATNYSSYVSVDIDVTSLNCDTPIDIYGTVNQDDNYAHWTLNWYNHTAGASIITHIILSSNVIRVRHNCSWLNGDPVIVVFEYTKKD